MAITFTTEQNSSSVKWLQVSIIADAAGDATGTTAIFVDGIVERVTISPTTGGTQPSAAWDLTITDGVNDILAGQGADLSNAADTIVTVCQPVANKKLVFTAANMGNVKQARAYVWWR